MPVPSFLASFADKAQSAIQGSPLASHLPSNSDSHTVNAIHNQLRAFGQQYTTTTPVQKIITTEKSVALDFDGVSRDAKSQSKELYTWGQNEPEDLKDVTDRLAYLNFVQGSLASSLAIKLDASRAPFKVLRDAEANIAPRRNIRAGLYAQVVRIEHDQQKGGEKKIAELKDQIRKAESDDLAQEKEIEILKRKAVRESEQLKWEAFREYGEKLTLLSQASTPVIAALPALPPSETHPYMGGQATGAARASLQRALDNYKTGHINLSPQLTGSDLHRSDTRSFGESHASELSSITSDSSDPSVITHPSIPTTPPIDYKPPSQPPAPFKPSEAYVSDKSQSSPINVSNLNQSPAMIPSAAPLQTSSPIPLGASRPILSNPVPASTPTIAETGVPVSAGADGPGPSTGSLRDLRVESPHADTQVHGSPKEIKGLVLASSDKPTGEVVPSEVPVAVVETQSAHEIPSDQQPESAADEKKRLEREERERLLTAEADGEQSVKKDNGGEDPPPMYQDI